MKDFKERLSWIRRLRGFGKPVDAARAFGWNESTYYGHENGDRDPSTRTLERYAKAFRVSVGWLHTGEGPLPGADSGADTNSVRVMGRIGAGAEILPEFEQVAPDGLFVVKTVLELPPDVIAFEVEGDSMLPKYDPGDIIVCRIDGSPPGEVIGWYAAVQTQDGRRYLKRVVKGAVEGTYDLESYNAPPIRGVRLTWISAVMAVVPIQQWQKLDGAARRRMLGQGARDTRSSGPAQAATSRYPGLLDNPDTHRIPLSAAEGIAEHVPLASSTPRPPQPKKLGSSPLRAASSKSSGGQAKPTASRKSAD